jgi:hypothetical protein
VKQITVGISLLLFLASSSLGSLEQISERLGVGSQSSLWTFDDDFSSDNARGRRSLKRPQRGKSSLKSFPVVDKPALVISPLLRIRETPCLPNFSKSSVYQQTNVYRI